MTDRALDVEAIFMAVLEHASETERQAYVERACKGDPEMHRRVIELLRAHEESRGPLDAPPSDICAPTVEHSHLPEIGTQIGPYKLLQVIGEGGMGVVYMAEQTKPVRRRVALKVIKPGMDSRQVIARFEAERQALAMMDHPNIAKVLDAGTTADGHPYFVMELVKGVPITMYCDEQHLTPRERLQLFVSVCQAVQHAHQKGVIHRDLKPSNVLVAHYDNKPVPKVIDFGLAKATGQQLTEKTLVTFFGQVAGTLEYMSPEQARFNQLDVDTRTDIYALGVILYELLTGATPFDRERLHGAALDEMIRIIRNEDPPKPSTRVSTSTGKPSAAATNCRTEPGKLVAILRGDLDWLVMKAIDKERERRYDTASSLAADIERYLNGEPLEARPPSAIYRLRKMASRHRVALATIAVVMTALVAGTTLTTWQAIVANRERTKAEATLAELRNEVYERALNEALLGGTNADALTKQAQSVGVPEPKLAVLDGLQAFYRGDLGESIRLLEKGERSVAARAVLIWAYSFAGDNTDLVAVASDFKTVEPITATDFFLLGQVRSAVLPLMALPDINKGMEKNDTSILGHTIRALARANVGWNTHQMEPVNQAIDEVQACRTFRPENIFVLSAFLHVHSIAYRLTELQGDEETSMAFFNEAEQAAEKLAQIGGRYMIWDRVYFLSLSGQVDEAMAAWKACLRPGEMGFTPMVFAPFACLHGRREEAIQALQATGATNDTWVELALAYLRASDPNGRNTVLSTYARVVASDTSCDVRMFALHLLLMSQQEAMVENAARQLLESSQELVLPYKAHIRFLAGGAAEELRQASPDFGHFDIALKAYSQGNYATARYHFEKCENITFLCAQYWWAKVYLAEIAKQGPSQ